MRHLTLGVFLIAGFLSARSQAMLDTITRETCNCISAKNLDGINLETLNLELGFCIIESITRHETATKDLNINIYDSENMRQFGEKIGLRMATICPAAITKIAALQNPSATPKGQTIEGVITAIEGNDVGFVVIRDAAGRTQRLLWLRYFKDSEQLMDKSANPVGRRVRIIYEPIECYSPRERDYFERKEIRAIEFLK